MQRIWGWSENGNSFVQTSGLNSAAVYQRSFPGATVTVYIAGSNNLATIYADNALTPLANPFVASNSGYWDFYAASGRYDVQFSGNNNIIPAPFTLPDIFTGAIQSINGQAGENQNLVVGTAGNNFNIVSANNNHTFNLPQANANNNGFLSASDWGNFNNKSANLTFNAPLNNSAGTVTLTTPLTVAQGGSNATTKVQAFDNLSPQTTLGDLIVFDGNNAVRLPVGGNSLALVADGNAANGVAWEKVSLAAGVSGVLPIANGGTNGNNQIQAFDNLSPISTKGDLIVGNNNAIGVRLPVGADGQVLQANAANTSGMLWGALSLASANSVTGILPIANGGTGANNATSGFTALSPQTTLGDLIVENNNATPVRLGVGANGTVLTANSANAATGLAWQAPVYSVQHITIAFNNNAFIANSNNVSVTLFTLGQYQKIAGLTVKPSVLFLNANNTMTDVSVSVGQGGNAIFYSNNYSVGNNGAVGNSNFQDTALFRSGNMGGNTAVLATFLAANANFGNGANTVLLSGSVDIWAVIAQLQ